MKIRKGYDKYYGVGNDWLCQTPAIAIGKGKAFLTITLYILFWSFTIEFNWEKEL